MTTEAILLQGATTVVTVDKFLVVEVQLELQSRQAMIVKWCQNEDSLETLFMLSCPKLILISEANNVIYRKSLGRWSGWSSNLVTFELNL
jgi:hypothetical protein